MSNNTSDLVDRLATPEETGLDPALLIPLLRLLAHGEPVTDSRTRPSAPAGTIRTLASGPASSSR